jgi:hypothetical protein
MGGFVDMHTIIKEVVGVFIVRFFRAPLHGVMAN